MELGVILEAISTVGFPIVLVIALCWFVYKIYNQSIAREAKLMEEITQNREVNKKAIETIALYAERLTHIETNIDEIKADVSTIKTKIE